MSRTNGSIKGPTSNDQINRELEKVEKIAIQFRCPVADVILLVAAVRIAITHPTIAPLDAARQLDRIANYMTRVILERSPELAPLFVIEDK